MQEHYIGSQEKWQTWSPAPPFSFLMLGCTILHVHLVVLENITVSVVSAVFVFLVCESWDKWVWYKFWDGFETVVLTDNPLKKTKQNQHLIHTGLLASNISDMQWIREANIIARLNPLWFQPGFRWQDQGLKPKRSAFLMFAFISFLYVWMISWYVCLLARNQEEKIEWQNRH